MNFDCVRVMKKMKQFERYFKEIREIDGVKTCIVSQEFLDDVLLDAEVFSVLCHSSLSESRSIDFVELLKRQMQYLVKEAKSNPTRIFLAFAEQRTSKKIHLWWYPIHCYKDGEDYYHVSIRDNWWCRECKQVNYDKFIMPMSEQEAGFYGGTDNEYPPISTLFEKKKCIYCGKILQNHFI